MSKNKMEMLGKVVEKLMSSVMDLNTIYDLLDKLDNAEWSDWLAELKKFLRKEPCWTKVKLPMLEASQLVDLFLVARIVLGTTQGYCTGQYVARKIWEKENSRRFTVDHAWGYLERLCSMGAVKLDDDASYYIPIMTIRGFEDTYNVKLPK